MSSTSSYTFPTYPVAHPVTTATGPAAPTSTPQHTSPNARRGATAGLTTKPSTMPNSRTHPTITKKKHPKHPGDHDDDHHKHPHPHENPILKLAKTQLCQTLMQVAETFQERSIAYKRLQREKRENPNESEEVKWIGFRFEALKTELKFWEEVYERAEEMGPGGGGDCGGHDGDDGEDGCCGIIKEAGYTYLKREEAFGEEDEDEVDDEVLGVFERLRC
ncbi:hypothetical protein HDV05_004346 [Chytridiales sp. JEL 0842]|nr:hypothetical protein HDV05_004346 [Chytridiales sp. JEL 0842]